MNLNIEKLLGFEGKTVVITGAASGMAHSAAELLLSLGAKVYAIDINEVDLPVEKAKTQSTVSSVNFRKGLTLYICATVLAYGRTGKK